MDTVVDRDAGGFALRGTEGLLAAVLDVVVADFVEGVVDVVDTVGVVAEVVLDAGAVDAVVLGVDVVVGVVVATDSVGAANTAQHTPSATIAMAERRIIRGQ